MTATTNCPECGATNELATRTSGNSFKCQCTSCGHEWIASQGESNEPGSRTLRLGQRTGHVAVLASMPTRQALNLLVEGQTCARCHVQMKKLPKQKQKLEDVEEWECPKCGIVRQVSLSESPGESTSWASGIPKRMSTAPKRTIGYDPDKFPDGVERTYAPPRKGQPVAWSRIPKETVPQRFQRVSRLDRKGVALDTDDNHALGSGRFDRFVAKSQKKKPVAHSAINRDSTEMGPMAPAAKSNVASMAIPKRQSGGFNKDLVLGKPGRFVRGKSYAQQPPLGDYSPQTGGVKPPSRAANSTPPDGRTRSLPIRRHSVESQARYLVAQVVERQRHPCKKCGGEGTVTPEGESEPVACSSCHGTGLVKRRQESADDRQAHHELWERVVDIADEAGEISGVMMFVNFMAQTYNGGIQQYIENGYDQEFTFVVRYVRSLKSVQAHQLAQRLRQLIEVIPAAKLASEEAASASQQGGDEEDPYSEFEQAFGTVEDWIYDEKNIDPILTEIAGPVAEPVVDEPSI